MYTVVKRMELISGCLSDFALSFDKAKVAERLNLADEKKDIPDFNLAR